MLLIANFTDDLIRVLQLIGSLAAAIAATLAAWESRKNNTDIAENTKLTESTPSRTVDAIKRENGGVLPPEIKAIAEVAQKALTQQTPSQEALPQVHPYSQSEPGKSQPR